MLTVSVWTGSEMLIHGFIRYPNRGVTLGYRPATSTWTKLAAGPAAPTMQNEDAASWTGSEMLVLGLTSAAYNPATGRWRALARGPRPVSGAVTGWTGHQVITWGGVCCDDITADGAAYTPATNSWRPLPAAPLLPRRGAMGAWTGTELVVAGGYTGHGGSTGKTFRDAAAYNPATGSWRKLPPMPAPRAGATAVWDGTEILFIGGERAGAQSPATDGVAYSPAANRWRRLPAMEINRAGFVAVWTGSQVLVWGGMTGPFAAQAIPHHGAAYNPAANRWSALPMAPLRGRGNPTAVWTGSKMIVWGGVIYGARQTTPFTNGAAYTPSAP